MSTTVKVQFLSHLAKFIGSRVVDVELDEPPTVSTLVSVLVEKFGEKFTKNFLDENGAFNDIVVLIINGLNLKQYEDRYPDPLALPLSESDDISFLVQFGGG